MSQKLLRTVVPTHLQLADTSHLPALPKLRTPPKPLIPVSSTTSSILKVTHLRLSRLDAQKTGLKRVVAGDFDSPDIAKQIKLSEDPICGFLSQVYAFNEAKENFTFYTEVFMTPSDKYSLSALEKDLLTLCPTTAANADLFTFIRFQNPVMDDQYNKLSAHRFRNWLKCVRVLDDHPLVCRFFTGILNEERVIEKAEAAADRVD